MTKPTEAETEALKDLLYLATHDEAVNAAIRTSYSTLLPWGNPGMMGVQDFAAALDSLYARIGK